MLVVRRLRADGTFRLDGFLGKGPVISIKVYFLVKVGNQTF